MSKIKLLICYHKPASLFKDEILTPIHVGRANVDFSARENDKGVKWMFENMIGDDTGENISHKNGSYNEMTSLYWAWKNYDALGLPDYIGLMHYRRHFVYKEGEIKVYEMDDFDETSYLDEINYSVDTVKKIVSGCDFVAHIGRVKNVYRHYIENHRKEDLDLAVGIMTEKYPQYKKVTEEYFAGDESNFCNMFIFSKEIFFEYCAWMFDILYEFEKKVDLKEKRLFITERLSGIFIANLMKKGNYNYKILPISFIEEPIVIVLALSINKSNAFQVAVTVNSIVKKIKRKDSYRFYFLYDATITESDKKKFSVLVENHPRIKIQFVTYNEDVEDLVAYLPELLKKENKLLYLTEACVALHDIGEFMRICSVDDYLLVGNPQEGYLPEQKIKKLASGITLLNCEKMRNHAIWERYQKKCDGIRGFAVLNDVCQGEIGYIPWYFFTREGSLADCEKVLHKEKRAALVHQATWRAWLLFNGSQPWVNSQGVYSVFWWEQVPDVAKHFDFIGNIPFIALDTLYREQQKEINEYRGKSLRKEKSEPIVKKEVAIDKAPIIIPTIEPEAPAEKWREYSLLGKLRFYFIHNGLRQTVIYSIGKVSNKLSRRSQS